ncbi:MAG: hypothetical protein ACI9Y1_002858 [Lentisphaeria bacterium]|jgi:hypothetical protein
MIRASSDTLCPLATRVMFMPIVICGMKRRLFTMMIKHTSLVLLLEFLETRPSMWDTL